MGNLMTLFAGGSGAGAAFVGMLDGYTVAIAYSMRRLRSAYTGPCLRMERSSDAAQADFDFDGSGNLDVAAIATWLGADVGSVVTWYDQSGNARDMVGEESPSAPDYIVNYQNSRPALKLVTGDLMFINGAWTQNQPYTSGAVAHFDNHTGGPCVWFHSTTSYFRVVTNTPRMFAGTVLSGTNVTANTTYLHSHLYNGASSVQRRNGAQVAAGNVGAANLVTDVDFQLGHSTTNGHLMEFFILSGDVSADFAALETNMNAYWGVY